MKTDYSYLARIAIKEIVNYYGEDSPCCYCITRPICSNLCSDVDNFLRDRKTGYVFHTDLDKRYLQDVWTGERDYMDYIKTSMRIMVDGVVKRVVDVE